MDLFLSSIQPWVAKHRGIEVCERESRIIRYRFKREVFLRILLNVADGFCDEFSVFHSITLLSGDTMISQSALVCPCRDFDVDRNRVHTGALCPEYTLTQSREICKIRIPF